MPRYQRVLEAIPAWAALAAGWIVVVAGWALLAPDDSDAPWPLRLGWLLFLLPAVYRAATLPWLHGLAFVAVMLITTFITGLVSALWLWLVFALVLTVPATYLILDMPRR
jgi:hypothetical protein